MLVFIFLDVLVNLLVLVKVWMLVIIVLKFVDFIKLNIWVFLVVI